MAQPCPYSAFPATAPPGNFVANAGPVGKTVGAVTTMVAGAQFAFAAGNFPQSIALPFGDDFPDPAINFNDPNNPDNYITRHRYTGRFHATDECPGTVHIGFDGRRTLGPAVFEIQPPRTLEDLLLA